MNIPTTPASVASQLTDKEILNLAEQHTRIDSGSLPQFVVDRCKESAAVLRDYVRLRKLEHALYERIKEYRDEHQDEVIVFGDIRILLADAEKEKGKC